MSRNLGRATIGGGGGEAGNGDGILRDRTRKLRQEWMRSNDVLELWKGEFLLYRQSAVGIAAIDR